MRLTAEERTKLQDFLRQEARSMTWCGFSWMTSNHALGSLNDAEGEIAQLKTLLRSLYWCAVNNTRVDPKVEDAIRTVLGEKPQERGGDPS